MDDRSFDRLARLLGEATDRRAGLKAALAAALGGGAASPTLAADARNNGKAKHTGPDDERRKKRKKKCKPACGSGFECVKGTCTCSTGIACGDACCRIGQVCDGGACVAEPEPAACVAAGEPCKAVGIPCCDGRVCASGQGGEADVACYVPKSGRCGSTADCVYGMACRDGRCAPPEPGDLAAPCDGTTQQLCSTPGAVCTPYDGAGAPGGNHCSLPLQAACNGDEECTCYSCWYVNPGASGSARLGREASRFACCGPEGYACRTDRNCCLGASCVNGICRGQVCVPNDAEGCDGATPCCNAQAQCVAGVCRTNVDTGDACSTSAGSLPCREASATCTAREGSGSSTFCVKPAGTACTAGAQCASAACGTNGKCAALNGAQCGASATGAECADGTTPATCTTYVSSSPAGDYCLLANGKACGTTNGVCSSSHCVDSKCVQCIANADCASLSPKTICDLGPTSTIKNSCVQCTSNAGCTSPQLCYAGTCRTCPVAFSTALTVPAQTIGLAIDNDLPGKEVWVSSFTGLLSFYAKDGTGSVTTVNYGVGTLHGIAFSSDNVPFVAGALTGKIYQADPATGAKVGDWATGIPKPDGVYIEGSSTAGTAWVSGNSTGVPKVYHFDKGTSTLTEVFSGFCTNASVDARAIAKGPGGYLYVVCDSGLGGGEVAVLDPAKLDAATLPVSDTVAKFGGMPSAYGLAFDGGTMWVTGPYDGAGPRIYRYSVDVTGAAPTATLECSYDVGSGLSGPNYTVWDSPTTKLWTSTFNGATVPGTYTLPA